MGNAELKATSCSALRSEWTRTGHDGQIRRDYRLCKPLSDYEADSEIIGVMEFVRDYKS